MAYTEAEARRLVIEAGHKLLEGKLVARTWGNISARISDTEFIITPSGRSYDTLKESELVKVNIADCSYDGEIKPSSEKGIHAIAYQMRKECQFVIHTHQFYASAICAKRENTEFAPCAGYGLPGTKGLKKKVAKCFQTYKNKNMFLMANHGAIVLGTSFEDAFALSKDLEEKCKKLFDKTVSLEEALLPGSGSKQTLSPFAKINNSSFVTTYLKKEKKLKSYIDDFAQIVGPDARYSKERDVLVKAIQRRNAVLVENTGAICVSEVEEDVDAISAIVEKNCAAALYVNGRKPLGFIDTRLQRYIYINKYSKLKK